MKKLFFCAVLSVVVGCASVPPAQRTKPYVGMTKDEVSRNYGKPAKMSRTSDGEEWIYDNSAMVMIPFNFGWKPKYHQFVFGPDEKVVKFHVEDF